MVRIVFIALLVMALEPVAGEESAGTSAQEPKTAPASTRPEAPSQPGASTQPATTAPSAKSVQEQMLGDLRDNPLLGPGENDPAGTGRKGDASFDPGVLGVAPAAEGQEDPAKQSALNLRRDGEFLVDRRGRVVPDPLGQRSMFVFEADAPDSQEPPMILMPCQMRQNMEDLVSKRGDTVVFIVSGQVYAYRGTNHLLPTMFRLEVDRGNLEP